MHRQQAPRVGVQRGVPQLLGIHLAQALEAADGPGAFTHTLFAQLVQNRGEFALVEGVGFGGWFFATRWRIDPEQGWPRHIHMAGVDQFGKVFEKQREQQHLDVRAIDIGIAQDANLAVAQSGQIGCVIESMRIDADGHRDVVNFVVGKEAVTLDLPGVQYLAAQRQNRLAFLVAAHLGAASGRVAFDQKHLVF